MGERLIREAEAYSASETDQLRAIRSHRNRRRIWRHMIKVRKAKKYAQLVIGIALVVSSIAITKEGAFALFAPFVFAMAYEN